MKSSMEFNRNPHTTPTPERPGTGRDERPRWVDGLRRYQLDGLVGWFLDAGRPFAFLSAQLMYMATPFIGIGAERVGRLLESDEESEAFLRLLSLDQRAGSRRGGGQAR